MPFPYERSELTLEGVRGFLMAPPPSLPPPSDNRCDVDPIGVVGELPLDDGRAFGGCGKAPTLIVLRNGREP